MALGHTLSFFQRYLSEPHTVGAVAPSSRRLAEALVAPFQQRKSPARVLEVGAGTGPVTRVLGEYLTADDRLDVCEIEPQLADILEADVLSQGELATGRKEGRVRLIRGPVQEIEAENEYDYVIAGLPFNAFERDLAREILDVIERSIKPDGTFSYFEYVALRRLRTLPIVPGQQRMREVSDLMQGRIKRHQVSRQTVWMNFPPAYARHWRFDR